MTSDPKPCIRCGRPRAPRASKYCLACREIVRVETQRAARKRRMEQSRAHKAQEPAAKPAKTKKGKKPKPQPWEFTQERVSVCTECAYYRRLVGQGYACHYYLDEPDGCPPRPKDPKDCYQHEGTPYRPKGGTIGGRK